jgi:hypothetical protein
MNKEMRLIQSEINFEKKHEYDCTNCRHIWFFKDEPGMATCTLSGAIMLKPYFKLGCLNLSYKRKLDLINNLT